MRVKSADGVELHVEVYGAGDPVLLLHGWPDDADLWRNQVPVLTGNGFRVIALDQQPLFATATATTLQPRAHQLPVATQFFAEQGEIEFAPVLAALREIGYHGLVAVELPRHSHAAPEVARRSLAFLEAAAREEVGR